MSPVGFVQVPRLCSFRVGCANTGRTPIAILAMQSNSFLCFHYSD